MIGDNLYTIDSASVLGAILWAGIIYGLKVMAG